MSRDPIRQRLQGEIEWLRGEAAVGPDLDVRVAYRHVAKRLSSLLADTTPSQGCPTCGSKDPYFCGTHGAWNFENEAEPCCSDPFHSPSQEERCPECKEGVSNHPDSCHRCGKPFESETFYPAPPAAPVREGLEDEIKKATKAGLMVEFSRADGADWVHCTRPFDEDSILSQVRIADAKSWADAVKCALAAAESSLTGEDTK